MKRRATVSITRPEHWPTAEEIDSWLNDLGEDLAGVMGGQWRMWKQGQNILSRTEHREPGPVQMKSKRKYRG